METIDSWLGENWEYGLRLAIVGSIIAAPILWMLLKLVGLSNKSIQGLWITYKEGNKKIYDRCLEHENYFKYVINRKNTTGIFLLLVAIMAYSMGVQVTIDSDFFYPQIFCFILLFLFMFTLIKYDRIIKDVHLAKYREVKKTKEDLLSEEEEWK